MGLVCVGVVSAIASIMLLCVVFVVFIVLGASHIFCVGCFL